jgi:hypothetical protein
MHGQPLVPFVLPPKEESQYGIKRELECSHAEERNGKYIKKK